MVFFKNICTLKNSLIFISFILVTNISNISAEELSFECSNVTETCDNTSCILPDCRCWGYDIPGNLTRDEIPQIVLFTFMRGFNKEIYSNISKIFKKNRRNPRTGAGISATLYVTNKTTDYCSVRKLWEAGHEIASHALTYKEYQYRWQEINQSEWREEMVGQRETISKETGIDESEIRGMRSPYFESGADVMMRMVAEEGFYYDSTLTYAGASDSGGNHGWPFTLDFKPRYGECTRYPCPTQCYKGIWEVPVRSMLSNDKKTPCSSLDLCELYEFLNSDREPALNDTFTLFKRNFDEYYNSNKAPIMFNIDTRWFERNPFLSEAINEFLEEILSYDDVFVLNTWQAIQWIKDPTPLQDLGSFQPWASTKKPTKPCRFKAGIRIDDIILKLNANFQSSVWDTMFSGNGLVAIEIIIFLLSAILLIIRDNADE